jgi:hypothetical protein
MGTYLLGPILALLPKAWRKSLPFAEGVNWERATAISGSIELVLGLIALSEWYARGMSIWVGYGVSQALAGKMGTEVRFQDIGGAALVIWATHPLTWLIGYFALEGAVRICAGAFGGTRCGTFPLFLADAIFFRPFRRRGATPIEAGAGARAHVSSFAGAVRERVQSAKVSDVPDELCFSEDESGEILEIYACRRKPDWTPPRVVRYFDAYYRLEADSSGGGARPFRYRLRRLAAGVPSRSVLLYTPEDAIIRTAAKQS